MFGSTLILGVSAVFLIQHDDVPLNSRVNIADGFDLQLMESMYCAKWTVSATLSMIILWQTIIALLSRSLDHKGSLKIDNRYLRLLPRLLVISVTSCLPLAQMMRVTAYLGILAAMLLLCLLWEWTVSLERAGGIFEP